VGIQGYLEGKKAEEKIEIIRVFRGTEKSLWQKGKRSLRSLEKGHDSKKSQKPLLPCPWKSRENENHEILPGKREALVTF